MRTFAKLFSVITLMSFLLSTFTFAQNQTTNLQQLIALVLANNTTLKAKKLAWEGTIEQYPQAIAFDDPKLNYTEALIPIETRLGPQDRVLSLSQKLPYPGKRSLKGEIVKKDIDIAKVNYDLASRDLIVALKKSFYELAYLENAIKLSMKNKAILEKITHIATTGYAASNSTLNDVAKAQSQYAQVSYDVQLLSELVSTEKTRINTLLNRDPEHNFRINTYLRTPHKPNHPIERYYQWAESNEELKIADLAIAKSNIKRGLSRYASLPDFTVGARYTQIGDAIDPSLANSGDDGFAVSVGINIPLNRQKNRAIKHQAYLERQRNIANKQSLLNNLKNRIKTVFFKITNSYRQTTLYRNNLIPQAERAKHMAEIVYRENKGSITQYLETQSTWLNFQLTYQRAIADYWKNMAEIEKITGQSL